MMNEWDTVIGIEVHVQLSTQSKLFSGSGTEINAEPNSQTCAIDVGLPGVLPTLNKEALKLALRFGLAIGATINHHSFFERKNYFYPDLPKGYQISQYREPLLIGGQLMIEPLEGKAKSITLHHAHLEEDAGKSLHDIGYGQTGIDFNRAGIPLLEIVSNPVMSNANDAVLYLKTLHQMIRYLGISSGNMQEGAFRCDINLSVKPKSSSLLGTKVEIKNLNSFKFIEEAIHYERKRQISVISSGNQIIQETRLYSPNQQKTYPMRSKETVHDYCYFSDPDLLAISIDETCYQQIKDSLPELPDLREKRLLNTYGISREDTQFLLQSVACADYFEAICKKTLSKTSVIMNWLKGELQLFFTKTGFSFTNNPISSDTLASLLQALHEKMISPKEAKSIFEEISQREQSIESLLKRYKNKEKSEMDEEVLQAFIQTCINNNPVQVEEYRSGKTKILGFLTGLIVKETKGKADPKKISELLIKYLK